MLLPQPEGPGGKAFRPRATRHEKPEKTGWPSPYAKVRPAEVQHRTPGRHRRRPNLGSATRSTSAAGPGGRWRGTRGERPGRAERPRAGAERSLERVERDLGQHGGRPGEEQRLPDEVSGHHGEAAHEPRQQHPALRVLPVADEADQQPFQPVCDQAERGEGQKTAQQMGDRGPNAPRDPANERAERQARKRDRNRRKVGIPAGRGHRHAAAAA